MLRFFAFFVALVAFIQASPIENDWRVVGGTNAANGSVPFQVSLRYNTNFHFCGGSIISTITVLTAAHCLVSQSTSNINAHVGTNKLNTEGTKYKASELIVHPNYDAVLLKNDVGIVQLDTPIVYNSIIQPVALMNKDVGGGADVTLTGWGRTSYPGNAPNDLQTLDLKTLTYDDCKVRLAAINPVYETQVCTFTKSGEGACHGDSGGPLVSSSGPQVGIVSWGSPCARGYPDVFTRVSSFIDWINENTIDEKPFF